MLQSKYLTKEGLEMLLNDLYDDGIRYMYTPTGFSLIYLSEVEPVRHSNGDITHILEGNYSLPSHLTHLLKDIFENTNCINIGAVLGKVDWSKVPVDTKVYAYGANVVQQRHFARYENGKIHTWLNGGTSWSTSFTNDDWDKVELVEEI